MSGPTPSPGDLPGGGSGFQPFVFVFEGLTMGDPDGAILLDTVDGLSRPDARVEATERPEDHGAIIFARFLKERVLTFAGTAFGDSGIERQALRAKMDAALFPRRDDAPLKIALEDGTYRRCYVKPTRFAFQGNRAMAIARIPFAVEFQAADPRWYDEVQTVLELQPQGPVTGFHFPLVFPLVFAAGTSGVGQATNAGTMDTPPNVRIYGPCDDPSFINLTTETRLDLSITLGIDDYLDLDFAAQTIILNGTATRYGSLDAGSWDGLVPGANSLQFVASGTNAGTRAVVTFRSAWASI